MIGPLPVVTPVPPATVLGTDPFIIISVVAAVLVCAVFAYAVWLWGKRR
jgi:hypothetical protein